MSAFRMRLERCGCSRRWALVLRGMIPTFLFVRSFVYRSAGLLSGHGREREPEVTVPHHGDSVTATLTPDT